VVVDLHSHLALATAVFTIGVAGFLIRRNVLVMLMCLQLMLVSANLVFAAFGRELGDEGGHVFVIMVIVVAAAQAAVGLALLGAVYRQRRAVGAEDERTPED
jgi:NADH-quinone oxidoreductase subunit K